MGRISGSTLVFSLTLVTLVALGAWWTVFLGRSVELERSASMEWLSLDARFVASRLGHLSSEPPIGIDESEPSLEIVDCGACTGQSTTSGACSGLWPLTPEHPSLCARPTAASVAAVEERLSRRRLMVVGEGSLLFLLLAVCTVMLFRFVVQEKRHLRDMERFVSALTHEMKTPLAGIKSLLQTLDARRIEEGDRQRLIWLGLRETGRLERSIENVLLSGSLRTNRHQLQLERLQLGKVLEEVVKRRASVQSEAAARCELPLAKDIETSFVEADRGALRVILDNLVDNALKYGEESQVVFEVTNHETTMRLAVRDGGVGFDEREMESLFEPLWRATREREQAQRGTGLGLYLARTLARRMGGDVLARSSGPDQGAEFTLELPTGSGRRS